MTAVGPAREDPDDRTCRSSLPRGESETINPGADLSERRWEVFVIGLTVVLAAFLAFYLASH